MGVSLQIERSFWWLPLRANGSSTDGPWSSTDGPGSLDAKPSRDGREPDREQGGGDVPLYIKMAVSAASLRFRHGICLPGCGSRSREKFKNLRDVKVSD